MRISFLLIVFGFLLSCREVPNTYVFSAEEKAQITNSLQNVFDKNEMMGMSLILLSNGQTAWEGYFGKSNHILDVPVDYNTMYRVASIAKVVTTIALLQLVERDLVSLDRDVSDYLGWTLEHPKFPEIPITLKLILNHRSGIQDGEKYRDFADNMIRDRLDIRELFQPSGTYYTEKMFMKYAPGEYFSYANSTWGLVASVIEKVSGQRFDTYCRTNIFEPMGISAEFDVTAIKNIESLAILYRTDNGRWTPQKDDYTEEKPVSKAYPEYKLGQNGLLFGPQGDLRISARDLSALLLLLQQKGSHNKVEILKEDSVNLMLENHWQYDGSNGKTWDNLFRSYGLGIHRTTNTPSGDIIFPDRQMLGHLGLAYGLVAIMFFDSDYNSGLVFITNGKKGPFEIAENSAFFQIEADVFEAIYPYLKQYERASGLITDLTP